MLVSGRVRVSRTKHSFLASTMEIFVEMPCFFAESRWYASTTSEDWLRFRLIHRNLEKRSQEPVATCPFGVGGECLGVFKFGLFQRSEKLGRKNFALAKVGRCGFLDGFQWMHHLLAGIESHTKQWPVHHSSDALPMITCFRC